MTISPNTLFFKIVGEAFWTLPFLVEAVCSVGVYDVVGEILDLDGSGTGWMHLCDVHFTTQLAFKLRLSSSTATFAPITLGSRFLLRRLLHALLAT